MAKKQTTSSSSSKAGKAKGDSPARASTGAKRSSSRKTTKKTATKAAASAPPKAPRAPKKTSKKTATKPAAKTTRKAATGEASTKQTRKSVKKAAGKTTKKAAAKPSTKTTSKPEAKSTTKKTTKKPTTRTPEKKAVTKKHTTKKTAARADKPLKATEAAAAATGTPEPAASNGKPPASPDGPAPAGSRPDDKRPASNRPKRVKPPAAVMPEGIGGLLSPGGPAPKPLIASTDRVDPAEAAEVETYPTKSPFNKRELEKYRQTLLEKRAQVLSEVTGLEGDALTSGGSGNLSHTPQHMADAGSDAADQTISLDLAAAERNLIKEIDAALQRLRDGVFGLCQATGRPIRKERLAELPWARYSIDAARQLEGKR